MENQLDQLLDLIKEVLKETCDCCGERQEMTSRIMIEAAIWGSNNLYEGVGIFEEAKKEYRDIVISVLEEEND